MLHKADERMGIDRMGEGWRQEVYSGSELKGGGERRGGCCGE